MAETPILDASKSRSRHGGPSFALSNRIERVLFGMAWLVLARWTPPQFFRWRASILRLFGARLGRNCRIHASVQVWLPRHLACGDNVLIGPGVIVYAIAPIFIGDNAVISQRAHLCTGSHDLDDPQFQVIASPSRIGPKAWIAAEAFVGPGITVGEGAVALARAVIVGDLAPWTVHGGNPARKIRDRAPH